jgi:hypothetical protein
VGFFVHEIVLILFKLWVVVPRVWGFFCLKLYFILRVLKTSGCSASSFVLLCLTFSLLCLKLQINLFKASGYCASRFGLFCLRLCVIVPHALGYSA